MLSVNHLFKTYKPKKGVAVKAIDDVSLEFSETGLVFILGKSGSGKSTLLNLIGGLDAPDSGELKLYNKSTKEFKPSDFDAYRNTFLGFIFQEYNILKEFTVGQNIALAMELQGKKATNELLNKILKEVDLEGYATRKPNELSGGQKQRVAIARALIKDPKIIMADEPTGALDSNTGRQVFDTLKRLSKDKLVIVVSHDREFAELYGDRVIELADGKVISDITKYEETIDAENKETIDTEVVEKVEDDGLPFKSGYTLTEEDLSLIREYIEKQVAKGVEKKESTEKDGDKKKSYCFKDTSFDDKDREYLNKEVNLIPSKFPYKESLRIGASSLKVKPFRLIFTILLSFISFAMFGLTDTFAAYNKYSAATKSILDTGIMVATVDVKEKQVNSPYDEFERFSNTGWVGDATLSELKEKTGMDFCPVFNPTIYGRQSTLVLPTISDSDNSAYYQKNMGGIAEIKSEQLQSFNSELYKGRMPSNFDEVAITRYAYEVFKHLGLVTENGIITADNLTEDDNETTGILNKQVKIKIDDESNFVLKIVGIIDTHLSDKYASLKDNSIDLNRKLYNELIDDVFHGIHSMMFVADGSINTLCETTGAGKKIISGRIGEDINNTYFEEMIKLSEIDENDIKWLGEKKTALADNEIIVPYNSMGSLLSNNTAQSFTVEVYSDTWDNDTDFYVKETKTIQSFDLAYSTIRHFILDYIFQNGVSKEFIDYKQLQNATKFEQVKAYAEELTTTWYSGTVDISLRKAQADFIIRIILENNENFFNGFRFSTTRREYSEQRVNIVGFYNFAEQDRFNSSSQLCLSEAMYNSFDYGDENYSRFIAPMPTNAFDVRNLVNTSFDHKYSNGDKIMLNNIVVNLVVEIDEGVKVLAKIFVYIGLAMALFSGLLLSNFIGASIANKKREIGILRALGAKSSDVFSIFLNESMIIALINFIISVIGTSICVFCINTYFKSGYDFSVTLLVFSFRQIALMLLISVFVAVAASFFPVRAFAKKQPIDSIQER